jgi:hypothetical protein
VATAVLILRLPTPAADEVFADVIVEQNRERRNEHLAAGGWL